MGSENEYIISEKITLNWSPTCEVIWTSGKKLLKSAKSGGTLNDICDLMFKRALQDYGISVIRQTFTPNDEYLIKLWKWIKFIRSLDESFFKASEPSNGLIGVQSIFSGKSLQSKEIFVKWFSDRDRNDINNKFASYKSEERNKALFLCEWKSDLDTESGPERLLQKLMADGKYTRAAAICIFNFSLEKAMECLTEGGTTMKEGEDTTLSAVAMALSGYTGVRNQRWCEMCKSLRSKFTDPYLKAMFYFLTSEMSNYKEILQNDNKLHLSDRVAFACKFLSDQKLHKFLSSLTQKLVDAGDLEGLFLVGLSNKGIDLLQRYVEMTSDVQTVSLIILHSLPAMHDDPRVQLWVDKYRELLDCWCLWHKRALFDIEWYKRLPPKSSPPQQLFVSCNFCGQSVSSNFGLVGNTKTIAQRSTYEQQPFGRVSVSAATNKSRIQSCPGCRKPLPRCSLCLTQLGTPVGVYWRNKKSDEETERKLSPFPSWFTSCQTCRHGGHANHLIEWFKEHIECPVSGCNCKCMSLDPKTCDLSEKQRI
ncbi:WD repeat-containing protein mio-like protein [Leptotrombidium deliense]|uniref:WD repeat-containing protein mio-like protein n=1 Tax=Leptotrombidium deliense TaxID=299467 RepID=A0A443SBU8_9ACAR|nr:WD repeat-containing protein mio-like protein [Leptotrombidium deliense]